MRESVEPVARRVFVEVRPGGERARQRIEEVWAVKRKVSAKEMLDLGVSSVGCFIVSDESLVGFGASSGFPLKTERISEGIEAIIPWSIRS